MSDSLTHRGPDGSGIRVRARIALGHRRLAIIDLHERSLQPMSSSDGKHTIVFNGEIYNFQALRRELEAAGHSFSTLSDTETILNGYREWGEAVVARLRGMFAFAIWDESERRLFLACDGFGKKPLYYWQDGNHFLFASEIKAILRWPTVSRQANLSVIHDYLSFGYCLSADTAFCGIRRLLPARSMTIGVDGQKHHRRYWTLADVDPNKAEMSVDDACLELVSQLDESVKLRLVSDVALGAFLSGGVDSSAVVARMAEVSGTSHKTFSVGFGRDDYDETQYAQLVAERYQTEHHAFVMDHGIIDSLSELIWFYGEPYADSSSLVMYALARHIRRHVTVAVSGDGGDEVMLGYPRYLRFRDSVEADHAGRTGTLRKFPVGLGRAEPLVRDHYMRHIAKFRDEHKRLGYGEAMADHLFLESSDRLGLGLETVSADTAVDAAARVEMSTYLPHDLLVKADIATMAHSLECRSPFLDHVLADWASSLPQHLRVFERHGQLESKALLKRAMEPYLPLEVLYRPKMGFAVPIKHWMQNELRDTVIDTLTNERFRERQLFLPQFTSSMLDQHMSQQEDHGTRIWALFCLELWFQTFIDGDGAKPIDLNIVPRESTEALAKH